MLLAAFRTWLQIISERLLKTSTPPFHHHVGVTRETKQSARSPADLGSVATDGHWTRRLADPKVRLWTDDYSNLLAALR